MWLKQADGAAKREAPQVLRYSRYYEHDGALRAYANRAMLLAFLCVPIALVSVGLAAYVRLQPPTVIRIDSTGTATTVGRTPPTPKLSLTAARAPGIEPSDLEQRAFVRLFLERYLSFSPENVNSNWAESLNMMTANLRRVVLSAMEKENTIGKIHDEQISSVFHLRSIDPAKDDPLAVTVFGVKEIHRVRDHQEATDKLVGEYRVRLTREPRSEQNPAGLLVAEYSERLIEGERRDAVAQQTSFSPK